MAERVLDISPCEKPTQEFFLRSWQVYRKIVDNNYLFHREAYDCLHAFLVECRHQSFTFLDIACGDAGMSVEALRGTAVIRYYGIDISDQALGIASENLQMLPCGATLQEADFMTSLPAWEIPVDIAWVGLSLHHLPLSAKREAMRHIRRVVGDHGMLLCYEPAGPNGDSREAWLGRWDAQRPFWAGCSEREWNHVTYHVHASDFPETDAVWRRLGHEAGFAGADELYRSPTDLFRLYAFGASSLSRSIADRP